MSVDYNPDKLVGFVQKLFPNVDGDKIIATIRTVVPVAVGTLLTWFASHLPGLTSWLDNIYADWRLLLVGFVITLVTGAYYALARKIESKYPKAGKWLLGSAAKPVYINPAVNVVPDSPTTGL